MEEYHQLLDSKSFSEETTTDRSSSDQNDETGFVVAARSYECVFCKRGFTTAQALGGRMNIHRKDRANNKISISTARYNNRNDPTLLVSPNTKKFGEETTAYNYASTTFKSLLAIHQSSSSTLPLQYFAKMPSEGIHVNYQTRNFPVVAATWGSGTARVPDDDDDDDEDEDEDDPHHEYLTLGIGIHTSSKEEIITQQRGHHHHHHHHHHHVINKVEKIIEEDVEVDLELRLGYDKY
ncbi:uncharacterized protein LOC133812880 [Humulus lupulus]|uniref:uncharacterized protein LOC133812880 n=1 Tax=Humulus lupulus TaxID=3486 RepID=UPI002B4055DE|nr:uncharacterized protein LOC133812880 [Humulus lupulus]